MRNKRTKKKRYGKYGDAALLAVMLFLSLEVFFLDWNNIREAEAVMEQQNTQRVSQKSGRKYCGQQEVDVVEESGQGRKETVKDQSETVPYRYIKGCTLSKKVQRDIFEICAGANISFELVMALIKQESDFDPACVSDDGQSVGLMQIQEKWHRDIMDKLGCTDLYDPVQNVRVGVELLKRHFVKYKDAAYALMAYNGGQAYADRQVREENISAYAACILEQAAEYERRNEL
ncbi:MAG: lytic transglycosylase domain-containing protein [Acetatifactor sp.]|nr:lytic transglycosylase domain-containing protein [Acetatifactor sp.]